MIDSRFVFLAVALSIVGSVSYVRDTIRGTTMPHRVTWGLWALEGVLAFAVEVQQHVGVASLMTLALGLTPMVVLAASFMSSVGVWKIDRIDIACGFVSLAGLGFWALIHEPTVALVAFVIADFIAALPTFRKAWHSPTSETPRAFVLGAVNTGITLLTLKKLTTAGALFPGVIMLTDLLLSVVILTRWGPRAADRRTRRLSLG